MGENLYLSLFCFVNAAEVFSFVLLLCVKTGKVCETSLVHIILVNICFKDFLFWRSLSPYWFLVLLEQEQYIFLNAYTAKRV